MIGKEWTCRNCGCTVAEVIGSRGLHFFEMETEYEGKRVWTDYGPSEPGEMDLCIQALDNGGCPVCDHWGGIDPSEMDEVE